MKKSKPRLLYLFPFLALMLIVGVLMVIREGNRSPGKYLYETRCQNCHQEDGSGLKALIPPLAGSDWLMENQDTLACIIRHGLSGPMTVNGVYYDEVMPANEKLRPGQIMNIINYINRSWGNEHEKIKLREVKKRLEKCAH